MRQFSNSRSFNRLILLASALLLPLVKRPLVDPKIPKDVFGFAATLVLLYGLDDLDLIESTCINCQKKLSSSFSLLPSSGDYKSESKIALNNWRCFWGVLHLGLNIIKTRQYQKPLFSNTQFELVNNWLLEWVKYNSSLNSNIPSLIGVTSIFNDYSLSTSHQSKI